MQERLITKPTPSTLEQAKRALADAERALNWYVDCGTLPVHGNVADFTEYEQLETAFEAAQQVVAFFERREAA